MAKRLENDSEYLKAYYDNEADANRQMSFANAAGAVLMLALWICYLSPLFYAHPKIMPWLNVFFPVSILILLTPLLYALKFKKFLRKPKYKFFVVFSFIFVIAVLNIILPRNAIIGWALCIVLTNHYYNPKLGRISFIAILGLMLICLYGSLFVGEYDPIMLGATGIEADGSVTEVFGIVNRYNLMHEALQNGKNYYLNALLLTYLPRAALCTIVFLVCNSLNVRTYKLLVDEINVNSYKEKTRTELEVAKDIQLATLPTEFITNQDIEIQAELRAAKSVGGDFYDYFTLDKDHTALLIADVSGKGIPAAMFMMKVITCFKNVVSLDKTPAETLKEVNRIIVKGNDSAMFVTCFYCIINVKTGEVKFANAGHNKPIIGQKRHYHYLNCQSGFILGAFNDINIVDESCKLENGDTITLYTDGITEARNESGEFFGEDRLIKTFNKKIYSCLVELHHTLKDDLSVFAGEEEQSDDITYITLKYHGDKYNFQEKTFIGIKDNLPAMLYHIQNFAKENKLELSFVTNLNVVADELLSNVIKYAYKDAADEIFIRLLYNIDKKEFSMTIIDKGQEFNPFLVNNGPLQGDVKDKKEGGLGILIVKTLMSEYAYDFINDKNIVTVKKRF